MIEVEVKVSVKNMKQIENKLVHMGFLKGDWIRESDIYFDNDCRNIKEKDMALRVRNSENLTKKTSKCFMTFKGPKMDDISMTRKELEMKIESADIGKEILVSLGYAHIYPVIKSRQYYYQDKVTACLDQVEGLGEFLELEIIVPQENDREEALKKLVMLLHGLGYESEEIIRTSYLSMLQNRT